MFPGLSFVIKAGEVNVPGVSGQPWLKLLRTTPVNDRLLYIAGVIYNDHQAIPQGLFSAGANFQNVRKELLPDSAVVPMDILERGETVYVLGYVKEASGQYTNVVYRKKYCQLRSQRGRLERSLPLQPGYVRPFLRGTERRFLFRTWELCGCHSGFHRHDSEAERRGLLKATPQ
ncbi:hypothetical protein ACFSQ7_31940 [Paenibacillus rhizoplanae]